MDEQGFAVSISTAKTSRQVETFHEARARTTHLEKNLRSVLIWAINLIRPIGIKTDALRLQNNQPSLLIMATMALICCAQCGHMHSSLRINCPQCKVVVWHKGIDRSDQSRRCGMPQRAALDKRTSRKTKAVWNTRHIYLPTRILTIQAPCNKEVICLLFVKKFLKNQGAVRKHVMVTTSSSSKETGMAFESPPAEGRQCSSCGQIKALNFFGLDSKECRNCEVLRRQQSAKDQACESSET